jgi:hypothetical protein
VIAASVIGPAASKKVLVKNCDGLVAELYAPRDDAGPKSLRSYENVSPCPHLSSNSVGTVGTKQRVCPTEAEQKAEQKAGQKAKVKGAPHRFYVPETPAGGATTTFSCAAGYKLCPSHPVCCLEARTCAAGGSPCGGGYGPCCY